MWCNKTLASDMLEVRRHHDNKRSNVEIMLEIKQIRPPVPTIIEHGGRSTVNERQSRTVQNNHPQQELKLTQGTQQPSS